jgi:hypothetical protein
VLSAHTTTGHESGFVAEYLYCCNGAGSEQETVEGELLHSLCHPAVCFCSCLHRRDTEKVVQDWHGLYHLWILGAEPMEVGRARAKDQGTTTVVHWRLQFR